MDYAQLASDAAVEQAAASLRKNGFEVVVVATGEEAKKEAFARIPAGSQVMTMSSETLRILGIAQELNESGKWDSVRAKFATMDKLKDHREMQRLGAAPEWSVGSVHAVTQDGHVLMASASGSQISAHSNGADHVLFVVGTQKVVADVDEGMRRIREHSLPLENVRAQKVYGAPSAINHLYIMYAAKPGRVTVILLKEAIGF